MSLVKNLSDKFRQFQQNRILKRADRVSSAANEALKEALFLNFSGQDTDIKRGDRTLHYHSPNVRNVPSPTLTTLIEDSGKQWEQNPLTQRLINFPCNAIEASGVHISADDPRVDAFLAEFWSGDGSFRPGINEKFWGWCKSALLNGELILPVERSNRGRVQHSFVDPYNVMDVEAMRGFATTPEKIIVGGEANTGYVTPEFQVIRWDMKKDAFVGDLHFFKSFSIVNSTRGRPMLSALFDVTANADDFVFTASERALLMQLWVYHVKAQGMSEDEQTDWLHRNFPDGRPPEAGSALMSDGTLEIDTISHDLKASDNAEFAKFLRKYAAGGVGFNDAVLGYDAESINVATMRETMLPLSWGIDSIQKFFDCILVGVAKYALWWAARHNYATSEGVLSLDCDCRFSTKWANPFPKDKAVEASSLSTLQGAISNMVFDGMMGKEAAQKVLHSEIVAMGHEMTLEEFTDGAEDSPRAGSPVSPRAGAIAPDSELDDEDDDSAPGESGAMDKDEAIRARVNGHTHGALA